MNPFFICLSYDCFRAIGSPMAPNKDWITEPDAKRIRRLAMKAAYD